LRDDFERNRRALLGCGEEVSTFFGNLIRNRSPCNIAEGFGGILVFNESWPPLSQSQREWQENGRQKHFLDYHLPAINSRSVSELTEVIVGKFDNPYGKGIRDKSPLV
jgi:hypothetical protein